MASRKKHHKLGQLWAEGDMTGRMQSEPPREGREEGREEVKQGGGVCVCVKQRLRVCRLRRKHSYHLLVFGGLVCICTVHMLSKYCVSVRVCVFVCARLRGPGRGSRSMHAMSGRAGVSLLMVPSVTTLPPSFLRIMSVT